MSQAQAGLLMKASAWGTSHLAVDQKSWNLCRAGLPPVLLAMSQGLHQGGRPLKPTLVSLHQASLDHAVRMLAPSQNKEGRQV